MAILAGSNMKIHALLVMHPETGVANQLVGVLANTTTDYYVSWVPGTPQQSWLERLSAVEGVPGGITDAIDGWYDLANGVTWAIDIIDAQSTAETPGHAAEAALDRILADPDSGNLFSTASL